MNVVIEPDNGGFMAYNITGDMVTLIGTGKTVEEAMEDFMFSFNNVKRDYEKDGLIPQELTEEVEFTVLQSEPALA